MKISRLIHALLVGGLSMGLLLPWSAHAALSDSRVCPKLSPEISAPPGVQVPEVCYSGFNCTVGMRGDWLDITNKVGILYKSTPGSGEIALNAEVSIAARGDDIRASNACVPVSQRDREGYVAVLLEEIRGAGRAQVLASRPAFAGIGTDFNFVDIEVRDGTRYLHPVQRAALAARVGEVKTIELTGRGLQDLRIRIRPPTTTAITLKPAASRMAAAVANANLQKTATPQQLLAIQTPTVSIISKSYDRLSLQVNFDRQGTISLADYLEFTVGDPAINRDLGWPSIVIRP
ncbi:MAG: hypothetical protein ABI858_00505 [Pseudoxanthomonas sp.]